MATYRVTANALRVRSGPGTTHSIVTTIYKDALVAGATVQGDWVNVTTADQKTGWSHRAYLELVEDVPAPTPSPGDTAYRVTATSLNVRQGPGTGFSIIGSVKKDDVVAGLAVSPDNKWAQIHSAVRNVTGWCSLTYLTQLTGTPPPPPPPPDPTELSYRVDATSLNVRQGPSTSHAVVGTVKLGDILEGLAVSPDKQWAQIRSAARNVTGWCSLRYLTPVLPPPPPSPTDLLMYVTTDALNFRSGPGDGYQVIGQLTRGEAVVYLNASPDWRWVNVKKNDNTTGWASSKYLVETNDLYADPANFPGTGLHRALSNVLFLRQEPSSTAPQVTAVPFNRVLKVNSISPDGKWKHCTDAWGAVGWYPIERLEKLDEAVIQRYPNDLVWLRRAYDEFGTREIPGSRHNPRIVEYLMSTDLAEKYPSLPDETDWCASFVNWCIEKSGIPSANSALVHPWRSWGKASNPPQRGAITTFLWDDGWAHVSMYLGEVGNYVICLGGNQSDAVWISVYHKKYITSHRVY